MKILGLETSCDETGVALYDTEQGLLAHALHSQDVHAEHGGVVPELASRDHVRRIVPLFRRVLAESGTEPDALDGIAYTAGPGLSGALLTGAATARSLAYGLDIPAVAVHHMEGHLLSPMLETPPPDLPFVALLVSGGHTMLVEVLAVGQYRVLGESLDDAVGEAFDKTAKLLGLGYPGGAALSALAASGDAGELNFPRPMTNRPGLNFSFSGLKTFTVNAHKKGGDTPRQRARIARAFVDAVVDTLVIKCERALRQTGIGALVVAGGVSANQQLRENLKRRCDDLGVNVFYPRIEFCTDNGAMIAYAGACRLRMGERQALDFAAHPRWALDEI